jgi:ATP-dependent RNA helicase DDX31/DBP7
VADAVTPTVHRLHYLLQGHIARNPTLQEMAMKGYQAALRAYATHSADTKHIFHIKKLHLGHFAKSFGLSELPTNLVRFCMKVLVVVVWC